MGVTPAVAPTLHSFTLTLLLQEKKGSGGLKVSFSSPSHPHFHPLGTEKEAKCNMYGLVGKTTTLVISERSCRGLSTRWRCRFLRRFWHLVSVHLALTVFRPRTLIDTYAVRELVLLYPDICSLSTF